MRENEEVVKRAGNAARGEASGRAKLSDAQVLWIREQAASGRPHADIARELEVSKAMIGFIARGERRVSPKAVLPDKGTPRPEPATIERDGEGWISIQEVARLEGRSRSWVCWMCKQNGIERRVFYTPVTRANASYLRTSDYEALTVKLKRRPTQIPTHLENVLLTMTEAATLAGVSRMQIWRCVNEGKLPVTQPSIFKDQMVRLGDLGRTRGLDLALLSELDQTMRAMMARDEGEAP